MTDCRRILCLIAFAVFVVGLHATTAFAICGDLVLDPGELCEDGNLIDGDGCDSNCTPTGCGNAVVTAGEVCDDGPFGSATCDPNCTAAVCGDLTLNPAAAEQCDDGNLVDGDGCDSNCTLSACGNGVAAGEACDDGNLADGDGCDSNCTLTGCGNGIQTLGESCDDGNLISGDGCDSNCTATGCGNGVVSAGEGCDDGNLVSGDGCDGNCTVTRCGNGVLTAGESCDDGNLIDGDGCDNNCKTTGCGNGIVTATEQCDDGNLVSGDGCDGNCTITSCGNGIVTATEQCDDGNLVDGDGCDSNCTAPGCGNGVLTSPEQCDDGNLLNGDGCDANCTATACGNGITTSGEACDDGNLASGDGCDANCTVTACGNGIVGGSEQCDDGNLTSGDGCDANCSVTACGNGIVTAGEACDDGNQASGDGCDANCAVTACGNGIVTAGEVCDDGNQVSGDGCDANCTVSVCGNGIVAGAEACDDGNLLSGDGCDATCQLTGCGSGVVTGNEQCDDGNLANGDGCSALCQREFLNPASAAGDRYGFSVAAIGSNLIIGAPKVDRPGALDSGKVYLVAGDSGLTLRTFENPTPAPGDEFGFSVAAIEGNVLVGAPFDDTAGPDAGAVYLFNGATGALMKTFVNPAPGSNDNFGWSIAALGPNVLIGAPKDDTGAGGGGVAYLYNSIGLQQVFLNPSPAAKDQFGSAVTALSATTVLIGAPMHDVPASGYSPQAKNAGEAYVFNAATGSVAVTLANPFPGEGDRFGASVASLKGQAIVGAPVNDIAATSGGAAYLFDGLTGILRQTFVKPGSLVNDDFGYAVTSFGLDKVAIGARLDDASGVLNCGAVYLFHAETGAVLQTFRKPAPVSEDHFGNAVATLGAKVVVGAPLDDSRQLDAGAVYAFLDDSCGNGVREGGEACDDGNVIDGDGCDSNCTVTACGNGVATAGEACDDGNLSAGDGCSSTCTVEGACGDGIVESFEQCDDGNLVDADGCDSNCTTTGCGNGIVTVGEQCDEGAGNGVNLCCSDTCEALDVDGDGICDGHDDCPTIADPAQLNSDGDIFGDACDVCPGDVDNDSDGDGYCRGEAFNPPAVGGNDLCSRSLVAGAWRHAKTRIIRVLAPPEGDEGLRMSGEFHVGSELPVVDPLRYGVQMRVTDRLNAILFDVVLPGVERQPGGTHGWKASGSPPSKWIYTDKRPAAVSKGVRKVTLKDLKRLGQPGGFSIFVNQKGWTIPLRESSQLPLRLTVELNDAALPPGGTPGRDQCGEAVFEPAECKALETNVSCKQR